mmetsp:Transcript_85656/g.239304  ORF Transcript_85656/g.239304 Transcript_85656/m.239304 type:complete len:267 (+) Transcript_85656:713-1513(+)
MFSCISTTMSSWSLTIFSGLRTGSMSTSASIWRHVSVSTSSGLTNGDQKSLLSKSNMMQAGWWFWWFAYKFSMLKQTSIDSNGNQSTNVPDSTPGRSKALFGAWVRYSRIFSIFSCDKSRPDLPLLLSEAFCFGRGIRPIVGRASMSSTPSSISGTSSAHSSCSSPPATKASSSPSPPPSPSLSSLCKPRSLRFFLFLALNECLKGKWYISREQTSQNVTKPFTSRVITHTCSMSLGGFFFCGKPSTTAASGPASSVCAASSSFGT